MDTRERRYMLGWDQDDMAVAFSWSQSKVARFEADPCSVKLTDEDKIRQEDRARKADAGRDRIMQQMIERKAVQLREKKNLNEWKEELGKREHWMMEAAHGRADREHLNMAHITEAQTQVDKWQKVLDRGGSPSPEELVIARKVVENNPSITVVGNAVEGSWQ
ncbi:MAG TPA: hypothetical protein VJ927_09730 [Actinomycetota bacterium]|nr:hypothetical protein [Actinomycetota bacterium]